MFFISLFFLQHIANVGWKLRNCTGAVMFAETASAIGGKKCGFGLVPLQPLAAPITSLSICGPSQSRRWKFCFIKWQQMLASFHAIHYWEKANAMASGYFLSTDHLIKSPNCHWAEALVCYELATPLLGLCLKTQCPAFQKLLFISHLVISESKFFCYLQQISSREKTKKLHWKISCSTVHFLIGHL